MEMTCADCGCVVEAGVRVATCADPDCCCRDLPTRAALEAVAEEVRAAFAAADIGRFGALLADDVRWGDEDAPNACHDRGEVEATFRRLLADGVTGEVAEMRIGRAGVLCRLRIRWPEGASGDRRAEVVHLYRVGDGRIREIEPFDDPEAAAAALLGP